MYMDMWRFTTRRAADQAGRFCCSGDNEREALAELEDFAAA